MQRSTVSSAHVLANVSGSDYTAIDAHLPRNDNTGGQSQNVSCAYFAHPLTRDNTHAALRAQRKTRVVMSAVNLHR